MERSESSSRWRQRKGRAMLKSYLDGQQFRARAQECRTKAELLYHVSTREKMLKLAANYDRMADEADDLNSSDLPDESATGSRGG